MALSIMPALTVEAAFGYGPFQTGKVWTNISSYVMSVDISRGRPLSLSNFDAGTCDIELQNDSGIFHPKYTAGPFSRQLLPNTPIRVKATWAGVTYTLFTGFAQSWTPTRYGGKNHAKTQVSCVDVFGLFANMRFPLVDDGVGGGVKSLGVFTHSTGNVTGTGGYAAGNEAIRVYGLVDVTELASGPQASFQNVVLDVTYTNQNGVGNKLGQFNIQHRWPNAHPEHVGHRKHHHKHAKGHHPHEGVWRHRIDMQLQGNDLVRSVQSVKLKSGTFTGKDFKLTIYGEQPILAQGLGDDQLAQAFAYSAMGVPSSLINATRGTFKYLQLPYSPWDTALLDVIRRIQETELGQIYVNASGQIQPESRDWRANNFTNADSWVDDPTKGPLVVADAEPDFGISNVVTMWEVTRVSRSANDTPQRRVAKDGTNHDRYGRPNGQRAPAVLTDDAAQAQADYLLARTKEPNYRYSRLTIKPLRDPANLFPKVLPMEISTPLRVGEYPPAGSGSFVVQSDQWVEHVAHSIRPGNWVTEVETSARIQT